MRRRVLLLYYSYTNQTRRVAEAMAEVFRAAGCEVEQLAIEFVDERYPLNLPLRPLWRRLLKFVLPQLLGRTGKISFDEALLEKEYDLICIGSPTWWFYPALPITTFLKSAAAARVLKEKPFAVYTVCRALWGVNYRTVKRLAVRAGGVFVNHATFVFQGNQVQSMFTFLSYLRTGEDRERCLGCRIYAFGVTAEGIAMAKSFATTLIDRMKKD
jgi:multimeric flavodoxin WrbA